MGSLREKLHKNTFYVQGLFSENPVIYKLMWKIMVKDRQATDDNINTVDAHYMLCK